MLAVSRSPKYPTEKAEILVSLFLILGEQIFHLFCTRRPHFGQTFLLMSFWRGVDENSATLLCGADVEKKNYGRSRETCNLWKHASVLISNAPQIVSHGPFKYNKSELAEHRPNFADSNHFWRVAERWYSRHETNELLWLPYEWIFCRQVPRSVRLNLQNKLTEKSG